jgi:hypothetical protein
MKKAVLRSAGTAALGVVFAAAAAGTASAAPAAPAAGPLGALPLAGATQSLPLAGPLAQTVGSLNPSTGARVVAQGLHTVQPTIAGLADAADHLAQNGAPQRQIPQAAQTRAGIPGGINLTPTSHGNSFGGPLGQVLGLLGAGSLLGG